MNADRHRSLRIGQIEFLCVTLFVLCDLSGEILREPDGRLSKDLHSMIDLQLTDDHEALVQTVREFAQKEVAPYIKEWDEKQEFHREVFDKMAELILLGVCIPEEYGGAGFDYISLGLVCEELEAVDTFLRVAMSVHTGLNSLTLYAWGTEAQKQKYLT